MKFFGKQAKNLAFEIGAAFTDATKAKSSDEMADDILKSIKFEEWDIVADKLADDLGGAFEQTAGIVLGQLKIEDQTAFDLVNEASIEYAAETGAELVTSITETTRERLRKIISDAIENADGVKELKAAIMASEAFGDTRAELIARTEIGNAHMAGALEGAKDSGLTLLKSSLRGSEEFECDICEGNEADGELGLDEDFSSGDDAPLFHPNCECDLILTPAEEEEKAA